MKKEPKKLPILTINNEDDGSAKRYVNVLMLQNALVGLQLTIHKEPEKLNEEIEALLKELKTLDQA